MPARATQTLINNIVNKVNSGQYLSAKRLILELPKKETVVEFLDALMGGS